MADLAITRLLRTNGAHRNLFGAVTLLVQHQLELGVVMHVTIRLDRPLSLPLVSYYTILALCSGGNRLPLTSRCLTV